MNKCKSCHWFNHDETFKILSNGKYYPCINVGVDGWKFWEETQNEPEDCDGYCRCGEHKPTGVWIGVAKLMEEVANSIGER